MPVVISDFIFRVNAKYFFFAIVVERAPNFLSVISTCFENVDISLSNGCWEFINSSSPFRFTCPSFKYLIKLSSCLFLFIFFFVNVSEHLLNGEDLPGVEEEVPGKISNSIPRLLHRE